MKTFILSLLISFSANAFQDITCWQNDCLGRGWTRTDPVQNTFTDFQCYREGCKGSGWIVGGTQGIRYYTQCKAGGCFQKGWYEIDRDSQMMKANIVCNGDDCLTNGWVTYNNQRPLETRCTQNDCRTKGWYSQTATGLSNIYCKNNSCFGEGWIESEQSFLF